MSLLWINKDATSSSLSQSFGPDESKIRRHAQQRRWTHTERALQNDRCALPTTVPLHTEVNLSVEERRSLDFFIHCTAPGWTGWEDAILWNDVAIRLSYSNSSIAHTLIALSALHESRLTSNDWNRRSSLAVLSLQQRDRAIKAGRINLQTSHLEALVSCLVLICLQNMQNGHHSFRLLEVGRKMLEECQNGRLNHSERLLVNQYVRPLFSRLRGRLCMLCDPARSLQISIRRRRRELRTWHSSPKPCIPPFFNALDQARDTLSQLFIWAQDSIATSDEPSSAFPRIRKTAYAWLLALHKSPSTESGPEMATRALLKAAYHFGVILLETFQCKSESVFDQYNDMFGLIVEAVEQAQDLTNAKEKFQARNTSFGIDNGLVDIVAFTGSKCRDPNTRRRALSMLMQSGRMEGGRLAYTAGLIVQALIRKEEQEIPKVTTAPDIPVTHRRHLLRGEQFFRIRKIRLLFERRSVTEKTTENQTEECWIDLPEDIGAVDPDLVNEGVASSKDPGLPDTIFSGGSVCFLDDRDRSTYLKIEDEEFFFPIPRA